MSNDPDLERDLERLMSRIDLPDNGRWVPSAARGRERRNAWLLPAAAGAIVVAIAAAIGAQSAGDVAASGSPRILTSPPLLTRPPASELPSTPPGSTPPRGSAFLKAIIDFTDDVGSMAADDQAFAATVLKSGSSSIVVMEFGGQRYTIATTRGRTPFLAAHGALRGDLVAYTETEITDDASVPAKVIWHVMVANWRTGAVTELDAIPGEQSIAPHSADYMPKAYTNGSDVLWVRTPRVNGDLGLSDLVLWRGGTNKAILRIDPRSELSHALADDGRIAFVLLACPRLEGPGFCPTGTRWELYVTDGDPTHRLVMWRDASGDRGGVGGPPAFAGSWIVWPRVSGAPVNVSTVDKIDLSTGNTGTLTDVQCSWIGTTVGDVVFRCQDSVLRMYPLAGTFTRLESNEADTQYFLADPHAIIGRRTDNSWVIRRVP